MTFSIIGSGNIAWFFGKRLSAAGHRCMGIYGRNEAAVAELSSALLSQNNGQINEFRDGTADCCFLAISDQAIEKVASQISVQKTVLIHTAGVLSLDAIKKAGTDCAVLWPVSSITKSNLPRDRDIPCGWEASTEKAEKYVQAIGHAITDILFEAKFEQRKWLHLSAVICNNFTNHLLTICEQICNENDIPFKTLQPIIEQTYKKISKSSPKSLQTGPAVRGDETTIKEHVALLNDFQARKNIYIAITDSIKQMYPSK